MAFGTAALPVAAGALVLWVGVAWEASGAIPPVGALGVATAELGDELNENQSQIELMGPGP